jgi:hypothetical protein
MDASDLIKCLRKPLAGRGPSTYGSRPKAFAIGDEPHLPGQGFLPVPLQRPRHQPVLRFGAGVAAARLIDLELRAFQTLTPLLLQSGALGLQIGGNRETGLQGRRLQ